MVEQHFVKIVQVIEGGTLPGVIDTNLIKRIAILADGTAEIHFNTPPVLDKAGELVPDWILVNMTKEYLNKIIKIHE